MKIALPKAGRPPLAVNENNKTNIKPNSPKKIMIMAGGTGGHVMPALAVARVLQELGNEIHWLGTKSGFEAQFVPQAGFPISYIEVKGLRRTTLLSWLMAPLHITKALLQSARILIKERPHVVLSMGGYASGPGALAAWLLGRPLILHEQNAIAGWTNRVLSRFAKKIMVAFPEVFAELARKVVFTGNPVRQEILNLNQRNPHPQEEREQEEENKKEGKINLLILGGSQGASILNQTVPEALALLPEEKRPHVWHQTGKNHLETTKANYAQRKIEAEVSDFIQDMAAAYAWADVVICRSGALTVAEIATVGVASILIPFPYAVDDHQTFNAKYLSSQGGAFLLAQSSLSAASLSALLLDLINNPVKRRVMAKACLQLAKPNATYDVAEHCLEVSCE
ncbi:MAG: undecaprenyldiphospho-muramoylpentapeptide beta-N-acetylglucosaminyltransferase [Gammaproteobacteria bacterium]|jgi:UDP-N-acetylglucosamine--N-acetylmuramyl-(pentapeptide) pyrophosphoryl-undecaprenol N-acetylglucosamine transferase|nr:undecaprenyldiphospho-muramoylpentapeptide beta-N-acetylglucosaminyltransferase [Gammaproteobacteria bacterium]